MKSNILNIIVVSICMTIAAYAGQQAQGKIPIFPPIISKYNVDTNNPYPYVVSSPVPNCNILNISCATNTYRDFYRELDAAMEKARLNYQTAVDIYKLQRETGINSATAQWNQCMQNSGNNFQMCDQQYEWLLELIHRMFNKKAAAIAADLQTDINNAMLKFNSNIKLCCCEDKK
jgi:hypothetical protein